MKQEPTQGVTVIPWDSIEWDSPYYRKTRVGVKTTTYKVIEEKHEEWCPQHGYPEPCAKCNGMTQEQWDRFFESLAEAVDD